MAENGEQDSPIMDGAKEADTVARHGDKARGILDQTEQDLAGHPEGDVLEALRQRFREAGVEVSDEDLTAAVRRISGRSS